MFQNKNQSAVLKNEFFNGIANNVPIKYNMKNFIEVKEGDVIYKPGDQSDIVYLIISGAVKIKIQGMSGIPPKVFERSHNQFFGEMEVLENLPRKSTSIAVSECLLYLLRNKDFNTLLNTSKEFKTKLMGPSSNFERYESLPELEESSFNDDFKISPEIESIEPDPHEYRGGSQNTDFPETKSIFNNSNESPEELNEITFQKNNQDEVTFTRNSLNESEEFNLSEELKDETGEVLQNWNQIKGSNEEKTPLINEDITDILICVEKIGSSLDFDQLFENIPSAICHLISASSGILFIHDEEKKEFYYTEDLRTEQRIKNTEGLPGICYINQDIINLNDDPIEGERNVILFPVESKNGELVSVLQLKGSTKGFFDEKDKKIIKGITPFIADAIVNTIRFNKQLTEEKLKALGIISNFLVNDIKRPLLMIKHYSEFLKKKHSDEDTQRILNLISDQSGTIVDLLEITKEFSQNSMVLKPLRSEVTVIMDEYLTLLAEYTDSRNVKVFRKYEDQGFLNIEKKKLFHAFYQIVKNACDAMPRGGNIFFLIKRNNSSINIEIKDEGTGISPEVQDKIFTPFVSVDKKYSAGLGLSIARLIIQQHNGSIEFKNNSDTGCTFIISLPAVDLI